jgi:hypothetical protein
MSAQDEWVGPVWVIDDVVGDDWSDRLVQVLRVPRGTTRFWLTPIALEGGGLCYRVDYNPGEMTECWNPAVYLFPRGSSPPVAPCSDQLPPLPLPPWQPAPTAAIPRERGNYIQIVAAISAAYDDCPSTERLEGDIHVAGVAQSVRLYRVSGVLASSTFLIIEVKADPAEAETHESGLAYGHSGSVSDS